MLIHSCKSEWLIELFFFSSFLGCCNGQQEWTEQPRYQEVNPHGSVVMPCVITNKKGECRWEKDGNPVGKRIQTFFLISARLYLEQV